MYFRADWFSSTTTLLDTSLIEAVAVASGLIAVWLATREHAGTWPVGMVSVVLYIYIFFGAKLYSDMVLHVFYIGVQFYGWHSWRHGGAGRNVLPVTRLPRRPLRWIVAGTLAGTALWGWGMSTWTDAALPWADAFTTVASFVAQFLMARKRIDHWVFWFVIDTVAIGVYMVKGLHLTAFLYAVYLLLCISGYRRWKHTLQAV